LFDRLAAFVEQLPKALENLAAAIRQAAERDSHNPNRANSLPKRIEVGFPEAIERHRSAEQAKQYRVQRWIAWGTWGAFIAASFYGCVAIKQWQEAKRQTMQTRQQMRLDKRAWMLLAPEAKTVTIAIGRPIEIPLEFLDIGDTPALQVSSFVVARKFIPTETFSFDDLLVQFGTNSSSGAIFPKKEYGGEITATVYVPNFVTQSYAPYIVTQQDVAAWNDHGVFVVVYGIVHYSDIFGVSHWTKLCHYYPSDFPFRDEALTNIRKCIDEGNDVDKNDQP
jgi:hypothetical protein